MSRGCGLTCGRCYSNVRGRTNYAGHKGYRVRPRPVRRFHVGALTRRGSGGGGSRGNVWIIGDGSFENNHPELYAFLAAGSYPDGAERITGTLLLFTDQGQLKCCLTDRDGGCVAFLAGESLEGLLDAAEAGLREDALDWRAQRRDTGRKPGKRS